MTAQWVPAIVYVEDVGAYGPYEAEIDLTHGWVWERPRFTRATVTQLINDHTATIAGVDAQYIETIELDGDTVVVTRGASLDPGPDVEITRTDPDPDGHYPILPHWNWSARKPRTA
ncbi:hypothetical protein [Streptomyces chryseus]|uniref:hypothetical protein n=1 Tax=Streptomyces chryseus TaxID=68186 RepID=UPI00110F87CF|nr:hypothetical protein [Streptomyces chryseus]GGX36410.1 hypothetical protein GCM10010353_59330 [Streptomyces chryseus]